MDIVNLRDSALKLLKPVISYPEQIALSSRQVLPVDNVQSANMLLQEELNRLFEGEEYTPSIALETIDGVTTAYTTLTDMDHILYKYQPI